MRKVINIPKWYEKNRIIELRKNAGLNQTQVAEQIGCVLKTYQNYEQGHNFPTLEYATALAELYKVSIDYLLGRSDCRNVDNSYIKQKIGLDDSAINTLSSWFKYQENMEKEHQKMIYLPIETLNDLLSDKHNMESLLRGIQDLLQSDYKLPAYHNGESEIVEINEKYNKCLVPKCVIFDNDYDVIKGIGNFPDQYLLTLVKDKEKTWDNIQINLDDDFFETIAIKKIEKYLLKIRDNYIEKIENNDRR